MLNVIILCIISAAAMHLAAFLPHTLPYTSPHCPRAHACVVTCASSPPPHPARNVATVAPLLAQTARVAMAAFQLSTFLTPLFVRPLYTAHTWAQFTPSIMATLQVVGIANLTLATTVHADRGATKDASTVNVISLSVTALIYAIYHVKPAYVNIPFITTLIIVALTNTAPLFVSRKAKPRPAESLSAACLCAAVAKLGTAALALWQAFITSGPDIAVVYLLQIALCLGMSAIFNLRRGRLSSWDTLLLTWVAFMSPSFNRWMGLMASIAAISAGVLPYLTSSRETDPR